MLRAAVASGPPMSLFEELKRRNVFRVGTAYLLFAWVVIQVTDTVAPALRLEPTAGTSNLIGGSEYNTVTVGVVGAAIGGGGDNIYPNRVMGDYAIVGAQYEDSGGISSGAAYVFYRDQGGADNWGQVVKLTASDAEAGDEFGSSVAIDGDYVVSGAIGEDSGGTDRGAAYIFYRNQGGTDNWGEVLKLTASDPEDQDAFGGSVAIDGEFVVVGAFYEDGDEKNNRGAAYIYGRNSGGQDVWGQVIKILASDAGDGDNFGFSVAIEGNFVVIAVPYEETEGNTDRGAVYIF